MHSLSITGPLAFTCVCIDCQKYSPLFCSLPTKHTLATQSVTSYRKHSQHPTFFFIQAKIQAYLCFSQAPFALDL